MKDKRLNHIGPGGVKCPCCVNKTKQEMRRERRVKLKRLLKKEVDSSEE